MSYLLYFPLNCSRVRITMSFGFPYPFDRSITKKHSDYFRFVHRFFSDSVVISAISSSVGRALNMNKLDDRVMALHSLRTRPDLAHFSFYRRSLFNNDAIYQKITSHLGVDLAYSSGSTGGVNVHSVCDGRVVASSNSWCSSRNCGGFVVIEHRFGKTIFYALYGHVNPTVSVGKEVKAKDVIGITSVGMTDMNPHLHFEIAFNRKSLTTQYPPYPYNQYFLNTQFLATYFYPISGNSINIPADLYGSFLTRRGVFLSNVNDYSRSSLSTNSPWSRYYDMVDPISFLETICPKGVKNPIDDSSCGNLERLESSSLTLTLS